MNCEEILSWNWRERNFYDFQPKFDKILSPKGVTILRGLRPTTANKFKNKFLSN